MTGGMGYYEGDLFDEDGNPLAPQQQAPRGNPLREQLKRVEDQLKALQEQNAELAADRRKNLVADALQAKGYNRQAAALYGGDPAKLDDWLGTYGDLIAKQPADTSGQGQAGQGTGVPASTVPAEGQAALQQLQQAGMSAAPPAGTEAEQIAAMRAAQDPQALQEYLRSQGNPYHFNG